MKLLRLTNAELKKIFLRPVMWVVFLVLVASLILASIIFNPIEKPKTSIQLSGLNIRGAYNQFINDNNANGRTKLNQQLFDMKSSLELSISQSENDHQLNQLKSYITQTESKLTQLYMTIVKFYKSPPEVTEMEVKNSFIMLKQSSELTLKFLNSIKDDISFYISNHDFDSLTSFFSNLSKNIPTTFVKQSQYSSASNFLMNNFDFKKISGIVTSLKSFPVSSKNMKDIFQKYYYDIIDYDKNPDCKLNKIYNEITKFVNENEDSTEKEDFSHLNKLVSNYKSVINMSCSLLVDSYQAKSASLISENNLRNYIGFENFNQYTLKQRIVKYNYLMENSLYDYDYLDPFSYNTASGEKVNAFDYTVFAMQIISVILAIFCIFIAGSTISGEYNNGTLKMLAIRPYKRSKLLLGKYLASVIFCLIVLGISFTFTFIIGFINSGITTLNVLVVFNASKVLIMNAYILLLLYFLSIFLNLIFFISFALLLSILFKSSALSVLLSFIFYLFSFVASALLYTKSWFIYLPFAHLDIYKYFGATGSSGLFGFNIALGSNFSISLIYLLFSIIILLSLSNLAFRKKEIS